jgi:hypothetical protein
VHKSCGRNNSGALKEQKEMRYLQAFAMCVAVEDFSMSVSVSSLEK